MMLQSLLLFLTGVGVIGAQELLRFNGSGNDGEFLLAKAGTAPTIWVDPKDFKAVSRTASDLAKDFGRVAGTNGTTTTTAPSSSRNPIIIAGSIGHSSIIDNLVKSSVIDVSKIK